MIFFIPLDGNAKYRIPKTKVILETHLIHKRQGSRLSMLPTAVVNEDREVSRPQHTTTKRDK